MERIKLNSAARNQLTTLKRRTGIEHNNAICRHALCVSLANPSVPPNESFSFVGGLEIDWRTLTGGQDALYYNLLRSEEHTSELQSLMRISYAVFCLKKKNYI